MILLGPLRQALPLAMGRRVLLDGTGLLVCLDNLGEKYVSMLASQLDKSSRV